MRTEAALRMELSALLHDLHLSSSSEEQSPSSPPPITELLSQLREKLIGSRPKSHSLIAQIKQLFQYAGSDWLFSPASQDSRWAELEAAYVSLISALIGCAALPLCEDDCSPLSAAAYQSIPTQAAAVCAALTALLTTLGDRRKGGEARERTTSLLLAVAPPTCMFAVTHFQDQVWTSSASRAAARGLLETLLSAGGWRDSAHLLAGDTEGSRGILGGVLDILQPQLTKDSWQRCEAVKLVFAWSLLQVTRPGLSPHLSRLLPPSLLFSDHHRLENCMLGVRCLHHIVLNTPPAELHQFNRAEVLYEALFKHLYRTEAAVIQLVLSCLLDLLVVLEKPPSSSTSSRRKPCRHDDVLRLMLTHMEAENKVVLRRIYAAALPAYIDRVGVAVCRHLWRLERVVLGYLEVRDPPEEANRLRMLEALQKTTRAAWPRMACRVDVLLRCLLRLMVDVSSDSELCDSLRRQLMDESAACLRLLDAASHGHVQHLLQEVDSSCCSLEVLGCLATAATATDR